MLRKTKIIGGSTLAAAAVVGVAVPAYATSTSAPPAPTPSTAAKGPAAHMRHGIGLLGLTPAVIAKDAGTDTAGLAAGRKAGKTLAQIAESHGVSRATLLSRLDATADARMAKLINTKLPEGVRGPGPAGAPGKAGTAKPTPPKAGTAKPAHPGKGPGKWGGPHDPRGWAHRHGLGADYKSLASVLKLTPAQLTADLRKGETLQQIATAQKVSTVTLLTALDKDVNAEIAKAVDRVPGAKPPAAKAPAAKPPAAKAPATKAPATSAQGS
ncbi:hypothetical protein [Allobranchiibius sp. GilTou73]|uniref:hypothetical protein n=1 Tax=Allobranchiibius sp. GilTou73 TaxID=2904523 RepID=UPI001F490445|nr:hypothetical protein [Allobranchiibius sp. GilTou73]UIJ35445.1 hypothetical protein LVQ62_03370 [Allobranchiibius sp. GilTou73]